MALDNPIIEPDGSQKLAVALFNKTWEYLENPSRTPLDDEMMLHCAHASCWHWLQAGTALHHARGAWLISRAYAVLGHGQPALAFARRCLGLCIENGFKDFDAAYAHEAVARACALTGDAACFEEHLGAAKLAAEAIAAAEDRELFLSDLASVPGFH